MKLFLPPETIKNHFRVSCFLIGILCSLNSVAQLKAEFIIDKTSGCSPLQVSFTNKTSGNSNSAIYKWDFGNGNSSIEENPSAIFIEEKTYTVTLAVEDGNKKAQYSKIIIVIKKPALDFSVASDRGCLPFNASFSALADQTGLLYTWDFGDGSVSQTNNNNSNHVYSFKQLATVSLTATNNSGCSNTIVKKDLVTVLSPIQSAFAAEKTIYCAASDEVQFSNTSSGPGILSYQWDFGDGTTSTEKLPKHIYDEKGIFSVALTITSNEGCSQTIKKTDYLNIANFKTDFTLPALLCEKSNGTFNNVSTPVPAKSGWLVNGTHAFFTYGNASITDYFPKSGLATIELTNTFGDCEETTTKQIEIKKQPALNGFLVDIGSICGAPTKVNFSDTSSESVKWFWNFTSTYNGPTSDLKTPSYTYTSDDLYNASLTIYNAEGCSNKIHKQVHISKPLVGIFTTDLSGLETCEQITKQFTPRSTEEIVEYKWNFGDGNFSTEKEPLHTFTQPGSYTVTLDYTSINGCKGTATYIYTIKVHFKPKADFIVQDTVCGNNNVLFTNKSKNASTYYWDFGNGATRSDVNPLVKFQQEGSYSVRLIAAIGLCADTVYKENIIRVFPPFANPVQSINTCDGDRGLIKFTENSKQTESWTWDFGDGQTMSYTIPPSEINHNYKASGLYKAASIITNGGCTLRQPVDVYVQLKQYPKITPENNIICRENAIPQIEINGLQPPLVPYSYTWQNPYSYTAQNGDGSPFSGYLGGDGRNVPFTGSVIFSNKDTQTLRVISKSTFYGCFDTSNVATIILRGPSAKFTITSSNTCKSSPVLFEDKSEANVDAPITELEWNWGDGKRDIYDQGETASHVYAETGEYYVRLTVTDKNGCTSTTPYYSKVARVGSIKAVLNASETVIPVNSIVNFYNNSYVIGNGTAESELSLFDGTSTTILITASYRFTTAGEYTAKLIARNPLTGCVDSVLQKITVTDFATGFTSSFSYIGNNNKCLPVLARFKSTVPADQRVRWDFGDGVMLDDQTNPSHIYTEPGTYIVSIAVYGYNRQYTDTIQISNPTVSINTNLTEACLGQSITLNTPQHNNVVSWTWDTGDGQVTNNADSFIVHQYSVPGIYSPVLVVSDANGCSAAVNLEDKITILKGPDITIDPSNAIICKGNFIRLTANGGSRYSWIAAQGINDITLASQNVSPANTTTYTVNAVDEKGCKGSAQTTITVVQPFKIRAVPSFAEICAGSSIQLNASGADLYQWMSETGSLNTSYTSNPVASPAATEKYTVIGYDRYQCFTDTVFVSVKVNPVPFVNAGSDIETIVGTAINLVAVAGNDVVNWNWSPSDYLSCGNCSSPVSTPRSDIEYTVTVQNQFNCFAKDSLKIKVACAEGSIYIPAAFSPNRDGKNDRFLILGKGIKNVKSLRVYNRWGQLIFEKRNFFPGDDSAAWDGTTKGLDAPVGTYVYIAEMECNANETFTRKGTVTLIR